MRSGIGRSVLGVRSVGFSGARAERVSENGSIQYMAGFSQNLRGDRARGDLCHLSTRDAKGVDLRAPVGSANHPRPAPLGWRQPRTAPAPSPAPSTLGSL